MLNIKPVHIEKQHIDFVSVEDDAIDWEKSFPDVHTFQSPYDDEEVLEGVDAKKEHYKDLGYPSELLIAKDGSCSPFTIFRFKNPSILANKQKLETIQSTSMFSLDPRKKAAPGELDAKIWQSFFVGYFPEGVEAGTMLDCRRNGNITQEYLQGFSNAGVLKEFTIAIQKVVKKKSRSEG